MRDLRYALVTPVRDEAVNLLRLATSVFAQTVAPQSWIIVDNGSTDGTVEVAKSLVRDNAFVRILEVPGESSPVRGAPIVRAFVSGVAALGDLPEVVVKLDADLSMEPDHFARLLEVFEADSALGIASGTCWELEDGTWRPQHATRDHVRGAARAYRRECLFDVLPLVEGMGWDGIDELKAQTRGWSVYSIPDLPILHHRPVGAREGAKGMWRDQGKMAHFMGYRPYYLIARAAFQARRDPRALAMITGYVGSAVTRRPRYDDLLVRRLLRDQQSIRRLPQRAREALGRGT
jgi:glycosyltransferase involved in cell wall biosynthesis